MNKFTEKRFFIVEEVNKDSDDNISVIQATSDKQLNDKLEKALTDMFCICSDEKINKISPLTITKNFKYGGSQIITVECTIEGEEEVKEIKITETCMY